MTLTLPNSPNTSPRFAVPSKTEQTNHPSKYREKPGSTNFLAELPINTFSTQCFFKVPDIISKYFFHRVVAKESVF
jgi:hypothetical protein